MLTYLCWLNRYCVFALAIGWVFDVIIEMRKFLGGWFCKEQKIRWRVKMINN